jgi:hypothetical protein
MLLGYLPTPGEHGCYYAADAQSREFLLQRSGEYPVPGSDTFLERIGTIFSLFIDDAEDTGSARYFGTYRFVDPIVNMPLPIWLNLEEEVSIQYLFLTLRSSDS